MRDAKGDPKSLPESGITGPGLLRRSVRLEVSMFKSVLKFRRHAIVAGAIAASALLAACGSGGGGDVGAGSVGQADSGTLRVALTDRPACGYDAVNVTIQKVRVHKSSSAGENDSGWSEVVLNPAKRVDLLSLQNGVLDELGQTSLEAGKYTQMRLVLAANDATAPMANSVVPTGGTETPLTTPSALQSGLKLNVNIDVPTGQVADVVIDFDACHSVVKRGNSGAYNLKPVLTVIPRVSFSVIGYVAEALGVASTSVSAQVNGVRVKSTTPDATGKFVLGPLAGGPFDIVVSAEGRVTATITGVPTPTTADITLNTTTTRIDPAPTVARTASGTVATGVSPIDAVVVAHKVYTGGPTVEVAGGPVDGDTGAFSFLLPSGAPVKAPYVVLPATLSFTADGATPTGVYTLVATSGGVSKTSDIDVTSAPVTGVTFTFP